MDTTTQVDTQKLQCLDTFTTDKLADGRGGKLIK